MDEEATESTQVKISIFTPLIYVAVLLSSFIAFSIIYRRRRVNKLAKVEPIFADNNPALLYAFLKEKYTDPEATKETKPHEKVMKAALLRRAVEAIRRSLKLKENEPIFTKLYQEGLIGEEVHTQFEIEAKMQEMEFQAIVQEVESFKKGWVSTFFPLAQEICFNEALRRRLNAMDDRSKSLATLWEYYVEVSETALNEKQPKKVEQKKVEPKTNEAVETETDENFEGEISKSTESAPAETPDAAKSSKNKKKKNKKK